MKLYRYVCGDHDKLGVAEDEQDAYERRAEVDPAFHYLPVVIDELKVDGYEVSIKSLDEAESVVDEAESSDEAESVPRRGRKAQA